MRTTGLNIDLNQYKDKITELLREFKQRFQIFDQLETDFQVFFLPFTLNASDLAVDFFAPWNIVLQQLMFTKEVFQDNERLNTERLNTFRNAKR